MSDPRSFGLPIVEKDFRHINKLPAMLQSGQPEIPILRHPNWHLGVISAVLLPNRTPVEGGGMNVIPLQQFASVKWADTPVLGPGSEELRIAVDNTNLRVRVQDCDCTVYPARPEAVVSIQGKDIFSL